MRPIIPPPLQGAIAAIGIWGANELLPQFAFSFSGQHAISTALISSGLLMDVISLIAFIRAKTTVNPLSPESTNKLVISGFYKFTRNPMYLGLVLMLIGWKFRVGTVLGVFLIALIIWAITVLQIKPEERALEDKFGDDYRAYKMRVRRWI